MKEIKKAYLGESPDVSRKTRCILFKSEGINRIFFTYDFLKPISDFDNFVVSAKKVDAIKKSLSRKKK